MRRERAGHPPRPEPRHRARQKGRLTADRRPGKHPAASIPPNAERRSRPVIAKPDQAAASRAVPLRPRLTVTSHDLRQGPDDKPLARAVEHAIACQVDLAQIIRKHHPQGSLSHRDLISGRARTQLIAIIRTQQLPPVDHRHPNTLPSRAPIEPPGPQFMTTGGAKSLDDTHPVLFGAPEGDCDIQISGTASDLALFLWQRDVTSSLDVRGDSSLLSRYFVLVPPV